MVEELADQPHNRVEYVFSEEQGALRSAVRRFCSDHFDEQTVRKLMESAPTYDSMTWNRLGAELGVLGLAVPESRGGSDGTLVDLAVAVEEFGAALACGPLFGTVYLTIPALVAASEGTGAGLLSDLVEGSRTAAVAFADAAGAFDPARVSVAATPDGDEWTVTGSAGRVVDGAAADVLLIAANGPNGVLLLAVDTGAAGVERRPLVTLDLTRPQADFVFSSAPAKLIAGTDEAQRVIEHALQVGSALLAVEQVGASQHLLNLTVDYAKSRLQFGRPIGSFQAVKHRLADMLVDVEHARSTAYHAVWALTDGSDDPALATSIAQATCSAAFTRIATDTIQLHGGIGFTWEYQAQLYYKRAFTDAQLLGSAEQHRARIAELVLDTASPDGAPRIATG